MFSIVISYVVKIEKTWKEVVSDESGEVRSQYADSEYQCR